MNDNSSNIQGGTVLIPIIQLRNFKYYDKGPHKDMKTPYSSKLH